MNHPSSNALAQHACADGGSGDPALAAHVGACAICAEQIRQLRLLLRELRAVGHADLRGPTCLDEDRLAALAGGTLAPSLRGEALTHVATCGHCRSAVASLARAFADSAVATATSGAERAPGGRWLRLGAPAAAAAVVLLTLVGQQVRESGPATSHREPAVTAGEQPAAIAPLGAGDRPEVLRWAAVAEADRYRVTLFREDGTVLYEAEASDTVTLLPDTVPLDRGASYLWRVEARTGWNRWTSSPLFRFSVIGSAAP